MRSLDIRIEGNRGRQAHGWNCIGIIVRVLGTFSVEAVIVL